MGALPLEASSESVDKLLDLYRIYDEQTSRLESHIWQTATLLGIGSAVGLVALAGKYSNTCPYLGAVVVAAIFAINVSFVWWRFARRWWSIQHLKFERMDEIEKHIIDRMGLKQGALVSERDLEAMQHIKHWREKGSWLQRIKSLRFSLPRDIKAAESSHVQNYEHRGIQPATSLLLATNVLLWSSFAIYTTLQIGEWPFVLAVFGVFAVIDLCIWRAR
jgi:hypothetical protein